MRRLATAVLGLAVVIATCATSNAQFENFNSRATPRIVADVQPPEIPEALRRPAKVKVARAEPQRVARGIPWSQIPRYLSDGTIWLPTADATAVLELEVEEGGIFAVATNSDVYGLKLEQKALLTPEEQWDKWGFHYAGVLQATSGSRIQSHALSWCAADKGAVFRICTNIKTPPVVFVPSAAGVRELISINRVNPYELHEYADYIYPPRWDYEPVDCLEAAAALHGCFGSGVWTFDNGVLRNDPVSSRKKLFALRFPIHGSPLAEYDLELEVTRLAGDGALRLGLVSDATQAVLALGGNRDGSGLEQLDGKTPNETFSAGEIFQNGRKSWVHVAVRATHVTAKVDGKVVVDYHGDLRRLGALQQWAELRVHRDLFVLFENSEFQFDRMMCFPLRSGPEVRRWHADNKTVSYRKWTFRNGTGLADHALASFDVDEVVFQARDGAKVHHALQWLHSLDQRYVEVRFGEGSGESELPADALARVQEATVYIQAMANSRQTAADIFRTVGFLYAKDGSVGYIAAPRKLLLQVGSSWGGPFVWQCGDIQVHFDYGGANERVASAELVFQGAYGFRHEDFVVLKVELENLPEPIDLTAAVDLPVGDTAYAVTYPPWESAVGELPAEERHIVVQKMPITEHLHDELDQVAGLKFQSTLGVSPGGPLIDREGCIVGLGTHDRSFALAATRIARYAKRGTASTQLGLLQRPSEHCTALAHAGWIGRDPLPDKATLLVAENDNEPELLEEWERIPDAKEYPVRFKSHTLAARIEINAGKSHWLQWCMHYGDRKVYGCVYAFKPLPNEPWHAYLGQTPSAPVELVEPASAVKEFPEPQAADESLIEKTLPHELVTNQVLKLRPTSQRPSMQWSGDGRSLLVLEEDGRLCKIALPNFRLTTQLATGCGKCGPLLRSKEGLVMLLANQQQLWVIDEASLRVLRRVHVPLASSIAASPALSTAYVLGPPDSLFTVDLAAGRIVRLDTRAMFMEHWLEPMRYGSPPQFEFRAIAATPDGRYLMAADHQQLHRFRLEDGIPIYEEGSPIIARAPDMLVVSPDGKTVALVSPGGSFQIHGHPIDHFNLYLFDIENLQKPIHIVPQGWSTLAIHPALKHIYNYDAHHDMVIRNVAGETITKLKLYLTAGKTHEFLPYPAGNRVLMNNGKRFHWLDFEKPGKRTNLMPLVDLKRDTVRGEWAMQGEHWQSSATKGDPSSCLRIPYHPASNYVVDITAHKLSEKGAFAMGLVQGERQFVTFIDQASTRSGIENLDGKPLSGNESLSTFVGRFRGNESRLLNITQQIRYEVSPDGVRAMVDHDEVFNWRGDANRIQATPDWDVGDPTALFIGWVDGAWRIESMSITEPR